MCSLLHSIQTGYGTHPAFYPTDNECFLPIGEEAVGETDRSSPFNAEVRYA